MFSNLNDYIDVDEVTKFDGPISGFKDSYLPSKEIDSKDHWETPCCGLKDW